MNRVIPCRLRGWVVMADLCDEHGLQPSQIYRWQAAIFEHGANVFDLKNGRRDKAVESARDAKIARLAAVVAAGFGGGRRVVDDLLA